jgi:hypothetical protein
VPVIADITVRLEARLPAMLSPRPGQGFVAVEGWVRRRGDDLGAGADCAPFAEVAGLDAVSLAAVELGERKWAHMKPQSA